MPALVDTRRVLALQFLHWHLRCYPLGLDPFGEAAPRCFTAPHGADDGVAPLLLGGVTLTHAKDAVPSRLCSELFPSRPPSGRIGSVRLPRPASESGHYFCQCSRPGRV